MLVEIPSLMDCLYLPDDWGFRSDGGNIVDFPEDDILSLKFHDNTLSCEENRAIKFQYLSKGVMHSGTLETKGKWRNNLPSGVIEFEGDGSKFFIIFEGISGTSKPPVYSDLSYHEVFEGELFSYKLIEKLTSNSLKTKCINLCLTIDSKETFTRALFVELFNEHEAFSLWKDGPLDSYKISAADIFNLNFLQCLISNQDFFFDYNDRGTFICHNIAAIKRKFNIYPIAFDFQFSAVLTPHYQRHREFDLKKEAENNAKTITKMAQKIPRQYCIEHIYDSQYFAEKVLSSFVTSPTLKHRYSLYMECFFNFINKKKGH